MTDTADRASRSILLVLFVGVLMGALDIAIVGPALPALRAEFGVDERAISWTFTIYVLFNLMGTPIMAKLSDRLGRRAVYVTDILLFAAGSLVVALAPSLMVLLVGRAGKTKHTHVERLTRALKVAGVDVAGAVSALPAYAGAA